MRLEANNGDNSAKADGLHNRSHVIGVPVAIVGAGNGRRWLFVRKSRASGRFSLRSMLNPARPEGYPRLRA